MLFTDDGAEFVAEQEKRYADAADSDNNTKRDADGTDGQRFECDHPSELFFGSAHRRKQTELLCSFRYGNGKCIVDKRDGGKDNQPYHNSRKTVKGGGNRVNPRNTGI